MNLEKINDLEIYRTVKLSTMLDKLNEEFEELTEEIYNFYEDYTTDERLASEMLDVIQCIKGISYNLNIDLNDYVENHNKKLKDRGHKIIDRYNKK